MKTLKRFLLSLLGLTILYLIAFHALPYLEARRWEKQLKHVRAFTNKVLQGDETQDAASLKNATQALSQFTEKLLARQDWLVHSTPEAKEFLLKPHRDATGKITSYCDMENDEHLSPEEIDRWIQGFDAGDLMQKALLSLSDKLKYTYIVKFHGGGPSYTLTSLAHYLEGKYWWDPRFRYLKNFYSYLDSPKVPTDGSVDPSALAFLEANSKFLTNRYFSQDILPKIKNAQDESILQGLEAGFRQMVADLGDCPSYTFLTVKDLLKPNACFENISNWKGPYVKGSLAEEINQDQPGVDLAVMERVTKGEGVVFQVTLSNILSNPPLRKEIEVSVPKVDLSQLKPTTLPECQDIYYQEVIREPLGEQRYKITAKGARWDSISEICQENLGLKAFVFQTMSGLRDSPLGIQMKGQAMLNGFWQRMKLENTDRIVAIDGTPNSYENGDQIKNDPSWPKKEGLVLEVISLAPPESQPSSPKVVDPFKDAM